MARLKNILILLSFIFVALRGAPDNASAAIINEPMTGATALGWVIGGSAYLTASTGLDPVGDGWLRFTSIANDQAGYGYLNTAFDITQGAVIQFDYVTWGGAGDGGFGCGTTGADGYSVYLFDGSQSFSVGASGGSLGYDKKTVAPVHAGLNYGYIGMGIDEWGNFSNPTEGRLGGPGGRCNGVAVRGPFDHPSGAYYYLGGTAQDVAQLAFPGQAYRPGQTSAQYRKVVIYLTPVAAPNYLQVDVYVQIGYNQPLTQVLNGLMVGRPVPPTVKIGYAASTGGSTNYHEIRNLIIDPLPSSNIDLGVAKLASTPTPTAGGPLTYTVTVRNYGPSNVTANNVPIADTVPAELIGVTWTCAGSGGATCGAASGSGNSISTTATLPVNSYATYAISGTVNPATSPGTQITNTATLTVPGGITDTDVNNNSSSANVSVTAAPVTVSGRLFNDNGAGGGVAHNGVWDGTEGNPGGGNYYVKLFRSSDLSAALQVVGPITNTFTLNNVPSYDTYTIIVSNDNTPGFTPSSPSNQWVYSRPANYTLSSVAVAGSNLTNQNFGLWNGARIDGKVIKDDGFNGALANANDGILNAAELGLSGVQLRLTNNTGGTCYDGCGTAIYPNIYTGSGGNFALFVPAAVGSGVTLRIYEVADPAGYLSVSYNAGTTVGAVYTIAGEYLSFTYTQYTDYNGVLFGDVPDNTFAPTPQSQNGSAVTPVYYAHTLTPGSGGSVSFAVFNRTQGTWPAVAYYRDTNCSGTYDGGDSVIGGALTASAGVPICILVQENIAAGAPNGATDTITTRATFTFTNSVGPVVRTYDVVDTTTVIASDLSTSAKSVVDVNAGDANPGDVLRYTITLVETAGVAGSGVSVTDDIPANVTGFTVISTPGGSSNSSTGTGTGANGTGYLNITNISAPASGSVTIIFDVTIAVGTPVGTLIDNTATVTNPAGPGATPIAPTTVVSGSMIPQSGNKQLYLYGAPGLQLSRTPTPGAPPYITIPKGGASSTWTQSPVLQAGVTIDSAVNPNVPVQLWLATNNARNYPVDVRLACSSAPGTFINRNMNVALTAAPALFTFNLPLTTMTCAAGNSWILTIYNNIGGGGVRDLRVYPVSGGNISQAVLPSLNVINVDSVTAVPAIVTGGSTVTLQTVVSDPFGSYDIDANPPATVPTVTIRDSNNVIVVNGAAMTEQVGARTASTKTFVYPYAAPMSPTGFWTATVSAFEGTEGTVSDSGVTTFKVVMPSLTVVKWVQTYSDPVNGTTNPKAIPGAVMLYTVTVTNSGEGQVDNNSMEITDAISANAMMYVSTVSGDPITFTCSAVPPCGLTFTYGTAVTYSNQAGGGPPYDYPPNPDANGYDANVKGVRINPAGIFNGATGGNNTSFSVIFRVMVK